VDVGREDIAVLAEVTVRRVWAARACGTAPIAGSRTSTREQAYCGRVVGYHGGGLMSEARRTSIEEARRVGDTIGVDWSRFDVEQFRTGMDVEYEHGSHDPQTNVTGDDPILTGKIVLAHMKELPDYYERLERMEREAAAERSGKPA
jgi:hypothetical protein